MNPTPTPPRYFVIIPAAGVGSRFSAGKLPAGVDATLPKQYQRVRGQIMLDWAIHAFLEVPDIAAVYVVLAPSDDYFNQYSTFAGAGHPLVKVLRQGGVSRHQSVLNGLQALADMQEQDWVLVHDAARPGLTSALVRRLIASLKEDAVGGLLALPVADTLKRAEDGRAVQTVPREGFWQAQTPQMFRYAALRYALQKMWQEGREITDEASAIEMMGQTPKLVIGSPRNFKVTFSADLVVLDALLTDNLALNGENS
ncbi:2-C-methyl-D-erythritol 4-phosphate cytidylyltransferase [Parvibium lacunae]|uniref:2-C-methyl-D-erythritol 4-phosphate cytidylyltransferase n=1 Tax=Parvibium lacunae TaxID=1888893 RepID=A0A368L855_9BURK|nr:2-C-methyl-D-erythritol 4-phosphate cytidylyltransferase [Parvibium lacunae]RCS59691.1 2-C-methyl-D-erythritol 4-phosphate cytidylyltransferase [Parvibium lacunae]